MDNSKFDINHWVGKSPEEVLSESFHELRDPIYLIAGYLNVLIETDVSPEQLEYIKNSLQRQALRSKDIVDSVYHYMAEQRKDQ
ncbi:MAG: hypothetical protein ABI986_03570 [Chloroflexota bacterium]